MGKAYMLYMWIMSVIFSKTVFRNPPYTGIVDFRWFEWTVVFVWLKGDLGSSDHSKSWQRHAVRLKEEKVRTAICEETCLLEHCVGFLNHLMVRSKCRIEINDMQVASLRRIHFLKCIKMKTRKKIYVKVNSNVVLGNVNVSSVSWEDDITLTLSDILFEIISVLGMVLCHNHLGTSKSTIP